MKHFVIRAAGALTFALCAAATAPSSASAQQDQSVVILAPATLPRPMSLVVNGQRLPVTTMQVRSGVRGTGTAADFYVSVDDLSSALGGTATTRPLQLQGNTVVALPITVRPSGAAVDSLDNFRPRTPGAAVDSLDNFRPGGVTSTAPRLPITVRQAGTLSTNVVMIDGKAYVPLSDLATALGGTPTIGSTQIDISAGASCATCVLSGGRSP